MKRSDRLAVNGDPKDFHLSKALKKTVLPEDRARRIIDSAKIRRSRPLIGRALGAKWAYAGVALLLCLLVAPGKFSASNLDGGYVVNLETRDEIKVDRLHLEGATQQGNEAFVTFKASLFSPQAQPEIISLRTQTEDISLSWEDAGARGDNQQLCSLKVQNHTFPTNPFFSIRVTVALQTEHANPTAKELEDKAKRKLKGTSIEVFSETESGETERKSLTFVG